MKLALGFTAGDGNAIGLGGETKGLLDGHH